MSDDALRLDKWLWHARFVKSRTLGQRLCVSGQVRVNRAPVSKAHALVRPGDVLTFPLGGHVRVIRVAALGTRRGPAVEAATLYEDLAPPRPETRMTAPAGPAPRLAGSGRPTKRDRRALEKLRSESQSGS